MNNIPAATLLFAAACVVRLADSGLPPVVDHDRPVGYRCTAILVGGGNCLYRCVLADAANGSEEATAECGDGDRGDPGDVFLDANGRLLVSLYLDDVSTFYVLYINYVRSLDDLKHTAYRLLKTVVLKLEHARPKDSTAARHINGSVIRFNEEPEQIVVDSLIDTNLKVTLSGVGAIGLGYNTIINEKVSLQVSEIRALSANNDSPTVNLRVYVTNLGLLSAEFFADASDRPAESLRKAVVHPQQTAEVRLPYECTADRCSATVRLFDGTPGNAGTAVVAHRKFASVRGHRCYCSWHAPCQCYGPDGSPVPLHGCGGFATTGGALSQDEWTGAGFLGDVPPAPAACYPAEDWRCDPSSAEDSDTMVAGLELLAVHMLVAVTLGLLKATCPRYRSHWLWTVTTGWLYDMKRYREPELQVRQLKVDGRGYIVHPVTGSRNVQLMGDGKQFFTNLWFFAFQPMAAFAYWLRPSYACPPLPASSECCFGGGGSSNFCRRSRDCVKHGPPFVSRCVRDTRRPQSAAACRTAKRTRRSASACFDGAPRTDPPRCCVTTETGRGFGLPRNFRAGGPR